MVKIAHASIDENNKTHGGTAGDQRGNEVSLRDWYNRPWDCVIRFKDVTKANKLATFMEQAANNNNIGYDQYERLTLHDELKKNGFEVSKISKPCETDCSALVADGCIYAGVAESAIFKYGYLPDTRILRKVLEATSLVTVYESAEYTQGTKKLKRGDILLNTSHHVAVVVSSDIPVAPVVTDKYVNVSLRMLKKGAKGGDVKTLQSLLNLKNKSNLLVDGDFGDLTAKEVASYQKKHSLEVDSIVGAITWASLITAT